MISVPCPELHSMFLSEASVLSLRIRCCNLGFLPDRISSITELDGTFLPLKVCQPLCSSTQGTPSITVPRTISCTPLMASMTNSQGWSAHQHSCCKESGHIPSRLTCSLRHHSPSGSERGVQCLSSPSRSFQTDVLLETLEF